MRYNAGLRDQKFTTYEGGIRTQCYWYWQDHWQAKKLANQIGAHIDITPTLLEVLDIPNPLKHRMDGISLEPVLTGKTPSIDRSFFQRFSIDEVSNPNPYPGGIMRIRNWKMIDGTELYDLSSDPSEQYDVATQFADTLEQMDEQFRSWWASITKEDDFKPPPIPIGHQAARQVSLVPHYATVSGALKYLGRRGLTGDRIGPHPRGVDGDWISDWNRKSEAVHWSINVVTAGRFEIGINIRTNTDLEANLICEIGDSLLSSQLQVPASDSFQFYTLDELNLEKGRNDLILSLGEDLTQDYLECKSLVFKKVY
jgi:hypothetical protein